jgi:hypothetical protein
MSAELSIPELKARFTILDAWAALSLPGTPGKSCKSPFREDHRPSFSVYADGARFKDHANGSHAGDVVDFIKLALDCDTGAAVRWMRERIGEAPPEPTRQAKPKATKKPAKWPPLKRGTDAEIAALAVLRSLPVDALRLASERGFLWFCDFAAQRAWAITDKARRCLELRTMAGQPWPAYRDLPERKSHAIGDKKTPLGLLEMEQFGSVLLVEGVGDFLAALAVIQSESRAGDVAPVACLGATVQLPQSVAAQFTAKRVRIVPQLDEPGQKAAREWALALREAGAVVDAFSLSSITDATGQPIKDLGDVFARAASASIRANPQLLEVCP